VFIHAPRNCRRCAAALSDGAVTAVERRQVFELPPVHVEVTEHRAETWRCPACGERTKAEFPRGVRAPVQYGEGARARAVYLHKYQLLPCARTAEAMRELFGCALSPGTLHTARGRLAEKLVGAEARIKATLRAAEVIGADETGLRVTGHSHWIHVARTDDLTHYAPDARRGKLAIDAVGILPGFEGVCVHDGWMAYDEYRRARHALCGVHLLRELVYVEEICAEQQQWTRPLAKLLLDIKAAVGRAKARGETKLSDEQLATFTARYDRLVRRAAQLNPPLKVGKADALSRSYKVVRARRRDPARPLISRLPRVNKGIRQHLKMSGRSYRVDETYIKVGKTCTYLYRAVDKEGQTIECMLSAKRDVSATKRFCTKMMRAGQRRLPFSISVDKNAAYPEAFSASPEERLVPQGCQLRRVKYLNNVIEQAHRFIKKKVRASPCFKSFHTAERTLEGLESVT
jgi:transposase-like protein